MNAVLVNDESLRDEPGEAAFLDALGEQEESVTLPNKALDPVGAQSAEKEQRVWDKERKLVSGLYNRGKGVDSVAQVSSAADDVDGGKRTRIRVPKHNAPP